MCKIQITDLKVSKLAHDLKEFIVDIESTPKGKNLEVLVDEKLNMSWRCVLGTRKPYMSRAASKAVWPAG